jgi:hypothetical protein
MKIKPLPKNLLIHTIEYKEMVSNNGWDNSFAEPITIEFTRVEPKTNLKRSNDSVSKDCSHVVFVDRENSSVFPKFKEESRIVFNGDEFELSEVKPFYDVKEEPHHYELGLK